MSYGITLYFMDMMDMTYPISTIVNTGALSSVLLAHCGKSLEMEFEKNSKFKCLNFCDSHKASGTGSDSLVVL